MQALRAVHTEMQSRIVSLSLLVSQSQPLYDAFKALKANGSDLTEAQHRALDKEIKAAELSGIALTGDAKERFNAIQQELSQLSTSFSNNLLDSTKAFAEVITDPARISGLPSSALEAAACTAVQKGSEGATAEAGPWCLHSTFLATSL